ncbi:MAG TPA: DNA-processing protein DprA, partial [Candidatus Eisenbacteria bacterium]|nr:DNA-processing protein DprA [Candidatus Eisenbacteria bacterium]
MTSFDELVWTMALAAAPGMGPVLFKKAAESFADAGSMAAAAEGGHAAFRGALREKVRDLKKGPYSAAAAEEAVRAQKNGVRIVGWFDAEYPAELKEIYDPPAFFYVRGDLPSARERKIAVVGSRSASHYGIK